MSWNVLKIFVEQLSYFWKRRGTVQALFILLLGFNFIVVPAVVSGSLWFLDKAGALADADSYYSYAIWATGIWALLNVVLIIIWFSWRQPPQVSPGTIAVFFAPESAPECEETIHQLYDQFKTDIQKRGLAEIISHSLIPTGYKIRDGQDADKLLRETGARLVIYGHVERGKIKEKVVEGFKTISFTVRSRQLREEELVPLAEALGSAIASRSYVFHESNSFIEKDIVIKNLSDVARFFIAAGLTLDGKVNESLPILEELFAELEIYRKQNLRQPQKELFYNWIVRFLKGALIQQFNLIYDRYLVDNVTVRSADDDAQMCQAIVDRLVMLPGGAKEFGLINAILKFHYGDVSGAKREVNNAKQQNLKTDPSPHLSSGFLHLWEGSYQSALREYMRAKRYVTTNPLNITTVIRFFHAVMEARPDKKQLRFGLAFVNDWFFDREAGATEYRLFLRETESVRERGLELIREHARLRLVELEKDTASATVSVS